MVPTARTTAIANTVQKAIDMPRLAAISVMS
jgi:hypothetical protein